MKNLKERIKKLKENQRKVDQNTDQKNKIAEKERNDDRKKRRQKVKKTFENYIISLLEEKNKGEKIVREITIYEVKEFKTKEIEKYYNEAARRNAFNTAVIKPEDQIKLARVVCDYNRDWDDKIESDLFLDRNLFCMLKVEGIDELSELLGFYLGTNLRKKMSLLDGFLEVECIRYGYSEYGLCIEINYE